MSVSHFDERSGFVPFKTSWGRWWQNVHEVHIELDLPVKVTKKDIDVIVKCRFIKILLKREVIIEGDLYDTVHADEIVWTLEDNGKLLNLVLPKAEYEHKEKMWISLLADGSYKPDLFTLEEMRKKLDLERFQLEHPGMNFSGAKLSKSYDTPPGM